MALNVEKQIAKMKTISSLFAPVKTPQPNTKSYNSGQSSVNSHIAINQSFSES